MSRGFAVGVAVGFIGGAFATPAGELLGDILAARAEGRPWRFSRLIDPPDSLCADLSPSDEWGYVVMPGTHRKGQETGILRRLQPVLPECRGLVRLLVDYFRAPGPMS